MYEAHLVYFIFINKKLRNERDAYSEASTFFFAMVTWAKPKKKNLSKFVFCFLCCVCCVLCMLPQGFAKVEPIFKWAKE